MQEVITTKDGAGEIRRLIQTGRARRYMLVCGRSFAGLPVREQIEDMPEICARFSGFGPNPRYEDVISGVKLFRQTDCDGVLAIGGGSALDAAKCIKLFCRMPDGTDYLKQQCEDSGIPLIAVPTTAGTGSESTRFAVIYRNGEKQSLTHDSILPDFAVLDAKLLSGLPVYQKKCAMLDALCQAIESWWSVNSTGESRNYSKAAVQEIMEAMEGYIFDGCAVAGERILLASNLAGRAINIAQTTAAHAMSYKLTSMYGLPHGHAAAVCLPKVWRYMIRHGEKCLDIRGKEYLQNAFEAIAKAMGAGDAESAIQKFEGILQRLEITGPQIRERGDLDVLTASVNIARLKNNPIQLDGQALYQLYEQIVTGE